MATVIWFFDQPYVPMELRFDEVAVIPLSAKDGALHEAARSFAAAIEEALSATAPS
jgi:hypothetical protein